MLFEVGSDSLLTPVPAHGGCKGDCAMSNCFSDRLSLSQNRIISSLALHLGLWNPPSLTPAVKSFQPHSSVSSPGSGLGSCTYLLPFHFVLFLMVLSFSQYAVTAGLQRAGPQGYGYCSILGICEVSQRDVNVNFLINFISACREYLLCCLLPFQSSFIPVFLAPYTWCRCRLGEVGG